MHYEVHVPVVSFSWARHSASKALTKFWILRLSAMDGFQTSLYSGKS